MGATNTHNYNSSQISYQDDFENSDANHPNKIAFNSPLRAGTLNSPHMNRSFEVNSQSLQVLSKQQIVDNNFSQQFDQLFTTFRPQNKNVQSKSRVLCSNITNQKIQQYQVSFRNQDDFRTYVISYFWRKINGEATDWPLARTTNFRVYDQSKKQLQGGIAGFLTQSCSSNKQIFCKVYVQDIPLRLSHIKDIPFPQTLYVLKQALKGFQIIYQNIGYIKPFEDLICITRKGGIKVWINSDLSKNYPNIEYIEQNITSSKSQSKLINQIIRIVNSNADSSGQPISLVDYLKQRHVSLEHISFQKIFQMISRYINDHKIDLPVIFTSILGVLNQQEQQYDTYRTDIRLQNDENQGQQNSQQVGSSNNSANRLFLDIRNNTSIKTHKHNKQRTLSGIDSNDSKIKGKDKTSNRKNKVQSLKAANQKKSLESSLARSSHKLFSESLPIHRNFDAQRSSQQVLNYFKNYSNNDFSRSKQHASQQIIKQFGSQMQKLNKPNKIPQNYKNQGQFYIQRHKNVEQVPNQNINFKIDPKDKTSEKPAQVQNNSSHLSIPIPKYNPSNINQEPRQKRHHTYNPFSKNKQQAKFISTKDIGQVQQQKGIETEQKLLSQKTGRLQEDALIEDRQQVNATQEQLQQMKRIDKYLQEQIIGQEMERSRLVSRSSNVDLEHQMNSLNQHRQRNQQQGHCSPVFTNSLWAKETCNNPPYQGYNAASYPDQERGANCSECSDPSQNGIINIHSPSRQMITSTARGQSSQQVPIYESSQEVPIYESRQEVAIYESSQQVLPIYDKHQQPQDGYLDQQQQPSSQSQKLNSKDQNCNTINQQTNINQHNNQSIKIDQKQSINWTNTINQQIPQNCQIPSGISTRNGVLLSIDNLPQISKSYIKHLSSKGQQPNAIQQGPVQLLQNREIISIRRIQQNHSNISSTSNQVNIQPAFQSSIDRPIIINSSTSIAECAQINSNPIHTKIVRHSPKVTFAIKNPTKIQNVQIYSSPNCSSRNFPVTNVSFTQPGVVYASPASSNHQIVNFTLPPVQRLGSKTDTIVSHYIHKHGNLGQGITSSRNYLQESSSSSMVPSVVQYSYLRHQQMISNQNQNVGFHQNIIPPQSQCKSFNTLYLPFSQPQHQVQKPMYSFPSNAQNLNSIHLIPQMPSLISNPISGILAIPEQSLGQAMNNSRLVIDDSQIKKQESQNPAKIQINSFSPQPQTRHRRGSSGVDILPSDNELQSYNAEDENVQTVPEINNFQVSGMNLDPVQNKQSLNINIKPSFCSITQSDHAQFIPNYSYHERYLQKSIENQHQRSNGRLNGNKENSRKRQGNYRFVESIQENRPKSTYQDGVSAYNRVEGFTINEQQGKLTGDMNHLRIDGIKSSHKVLSGIFNPNSGSRQHHPISHSRQPYPQGYRSSSGSRSPSPRKFPMNPVTGHTMFLNNQNQLNSQFVDQQSQPQSQVDYTYNSYDKWKDTSRIGFVGNGNNRFRNCDEYNNDDEHFEHPLKYNVGERHGNHKQLVKSSIQGLNNTFSNNLFLNHFNTDRKFEEQPKYCQIQKNTQQPVITSQKSSVNNFFRGETKQKQEQMDEEILKDLSML